MRLNTTRRGFLTGASAIAALPLTARAQNVTEAPQLNANETDRAVPYHGAHQAGIVTPRPAHGMIASFDVVSDTPEQLESMLRRLTERIAFLTTGGPVPMLDPKLPPADSGLLGDMLRPDALTITVSLGASLFDRLEWLTPHKPLRLSRMVKFPNDALDAAQCHGDLSLQICANTQDTTIHALRDIIKTLRDHMILTWKQEGNVPIASHGDKGSARNFLGFRDGSANPDAHDAALMDQLVWAGADEPDWAQGGSYQAVRIIRNFVERWDRTPLGEQERIIGRVRPTGAPLDQPHRDEFTEPQFDGDPEGKVTPLDSHIRLANARNAQSPTVLILRRPFNYSNGVTKSGQLDQGLLFICYQADLDSGFIAAQKRLDGEPLEEYIKPVGGGYFFTLPGITDPADYLGSQLIDTVRSAATSTL